MLPAACCLLCSGMGVPLQPASWHSLQKEKMMEAKGQGDLQLFQVALSHRSTWTSTSLACDCGMQMAFESRLKICRLSQSVLFHVCYCH